ncbi:MAG: hypothetical protein AB1762_19820, partial [Gemmatimonadota bacterium]
ATGGLAEALAPFCESFEKVVPELTLVGLRLAFELLNQPATVRKQTAGCAVSCYPSATYLTPFGHLSRLDRLAGCD